MKILSCIVLVLAGTGLATIGRSVAPEPLRFNPGGPWLDQSGHPINAHGGGILLFQGVYYWYGEHKLPGKSEKEGADGGVHCYSSTNLCDWKDEGVVLGINPADVAGEPEHGCKLQRPKVLFNERTQTFVMFFKYYPRATGYDTAYVGVATARSTRGPFVYSHKFLAADSPKGSGDYVMFTAADGTVYHLTVRKPDKAFCIGKLRDDYLYPAGPYRVVEGIPLHTEAPAIMVRNGKYYLLGSGSTGWNPNAARSFVADDLAGPYASTGNPCAGVNPHNGLGPEKTFGGQISFILPVAGKPDVFIALFDLWKPAVAEEGLYAWLPVQLADGKPLVEWRDRWDLPARRGE